MHAIANQILAVPVGVQFARRFAPALADQTQLRNKYLLVEALEGAGRKDEAMKLYKEVSVNNFNTADFAVLRAEALKKVG